MKEVINKVKIQSIWMKFVFYMLTAFLPACLYSVIFYIPTAISLPESEVINIIYHEFYIAFLCVYFLFTVCAFNRVAMYLCVTFFYACGSSYIYFVINFKSPLNFSAMKFVSYQNRIESALNMFSMQGVLLGMIFALIGLTAMQKSFIFWKKYKNLSQSFANSIMSKAFIALSLFSLISYFSAGNGSEFVNQYTPYSMVKYFIVNTRDKLTTTIVQREDISRNNNFICDKSEEPTNIVLILGESMVRNDLSISGYRRRKNMPRMEKVSNLVNLSGNVREYGVFLPSIFLRNLYFGKKELIKESSLISIFRMLGFKTTVISSHTKAYEQEMKMSSVFVEAEKVIYRSMAAASLNVDSNSLMDHQIIDIMRNELKNNEGKSNMMILNTMGNRWPYHSVYPRDFAVFHPECLSSVPSNCTIFELRNSYHNSISYTDYIISEAIKNLEDKKSILFYVSNYGKELEGLNRRYKEGDYNAQNSNNAMLVWASDKFLDEHGKEFDNIKHKEGDKVSVRNIFHSMLGCVGIQSDIIDPSLNLCSKNRSVN